MIDEPLVRALAKDEAIVFVGSGASIPSGLPDWRGFLKSMLEYAKTLPGEDWSRTEGFLGTDGDFLLAAEMLQRQLPPPTFTRFIEEAFGKPGLEPNEIHRSIARLPFSLAVTTNIDSLLEAAYGSPTTCTWRDPDAVFNAIRSRKFAVVKLHGSVSDPLSARLTRTHYRDGALTNPEFNECIKHLLTWKTFLFVGYSLRDSDLLYLIDEARLRYGKKFGPHYAIMPKHEADTKFQAYLKDALSIETIEYERDQNIPGSATGEVVRILKELAGRVSEARYGGYGIGLGLNDPSITRDEAAQAILDLAAPMTGSMRGDVAMIKDDIYPELRPAAIFSRKREVPLPASVPQYSIIENVFLQAAKEVAEDYVYIEDVEKAAEDLHKMGYDHAHYIACDTAVKSELACPIVADGRRVGTLNLESDLIAAYTPKHIKVATRIAAELGRVYLQSEQRRRTAAPIEYYDRTPRRFAEMMRKSRLVKNLNHDFLLYVIDYENRQLKAHHTSGETISHPFGVNSLAYRVLSTRKTLTVLDAEVEAEKKDGLVNPKGVKQFKIRGPIFACPVRAAGQTEAVLVTWLKPQTVVTDERELLHWFQSSSRQVQRLANLLANDIFRTQSSSRLTMEKSGLRRSSTTRSFARESSMPSCSPCSYPTLD
jgi:GAF domain-containing protein